MPLVQEALQYDEMRSVGRTRLRRNYIVVKCIMCGQEGHNRKGYPRRAFIHSQNTTSEPQDTNSDAIGAGNTNPLAPSPRDA